MGRRRSRSRDVQRSASTLEVDIQARAEASGVTVNDMIGDANAGGPDVDTVSVGPKRSKSRRARRGKSRRRNATGGESPVRRRRSRRKKSEGSGNEIAQQLQDSAITI